MLFINSFIRNIITHFKSKVMFFLCESTRKGDKNLNQTAAKWKKEKKMSCSSVISSFQLENEINFHLCNYLNSFADAAGTASSGIFLYKPHLSCTHTQTLHPSIVRHSAICLNLSYDNSAHETINNVKTATVKKQQRKLFILSGRRTTETTRLYTSLKAKTDWRFWLNPS